MIGVASRVNKERDFENLTLSDKNVVKYLILYRSNIDVSYSLNTNININEIGDVFSLNQELIALYISLDEIIKQCNFKDKQLELLELLFIGYKMKNISEMKIGYKKSSAYDTFNRIINKIVKKNDENWKNYITKVEGQQGRKKYE